MATHKRKTQADEFLAEYNIKQDAQDAQADQDAQDAQDKTDADKEVADFVGKPTPETQAHKDAVKEGIVPDDKAAEQEQAKVVQIQDRARKQAANNATFAQRRAQNIKTATDPIIRKGAQVVDYVGAAKTVGGVGLLLVILFLLLFIVVRVNAAGNTRLQQLWSMLNGRATLTGAVTPTGIESNGGGASGDFSAAPNNPFNGTSSTNTFPSATLAQDASTFAGSYRTYTGGI
jgi:hypothetical protein